MVEATLAEAVKGGVAVIRPPRLRAGDVIGIATPSGSIAAYPARLRRGIATLQRLGFQVRVGELAWEADGWVSAPARRRAEELNAFVRAPEVRAIFTSIGGWNTNGVLDDFDFEALRADPKIILGYSDITALLVAAYQRTGVVTFHGPTVLPELAEYPEVLAYTREALMHILCRAEPAGPLVAPECWTEEFLAWGRDDTRPRELRSAQPWQWLCPGKGRGLLVGGNLETLCALAGTQFFPDLRGRLLFCETISTSLAAIERAIVQLAQQGSLEGLAGLVFGHSFRVGMGFETQLQSMLRRMCAEASYPVLAGVHLGHTDPMLTLPLGITAELDSARGCFEVLDAAVS